MSVQIQMNPGVIQKRGLEIRNINFFGFMMPDDEYPFGSARGRDIGERLSRPHQLRITILRENILMKTAGFSDGRAIGVLCATGVPTPAVIPAIIFHTRVCIKDDDVDDDAVGVSPDNYPPMIITPVHNPPRNRFVERELCLRRESIVMVAERMIPRYPQSTEYVDIILADLRVARILDTAIIEVVAGIQDERGGVLANLHLLCNIRFHRRRGVVGVS